MRLSLKARIATMTFLVASAAFLLLPFVTGPSKVVAADDPVSKGRIMAQSICMECHSPRIAGDRYHLDPNKLFAGGEEAFEGPWGKVYAVNISSDKETGIGGWTDAQIKQAITKGIGDEGEKLLVMPWEIFQGLADEDVNNIIAYLRTVPPVRNTTPPAQLAPPQAVEGFVNSIPPLKAVVPAALFSSPRDVFHDYFFATQPYASKPAPAGFQAPQGKDSPARGGYLAKNLLGCTVCHGANLAGGIPPFFARNVTPDIETGIGLWTNEDIVRALREGLRPTGLRRREGGDRPTGEAAPGVRLLDPTMPSTTAFLNLSDDEVYNVIAYLKSIPPVRRAQGEPNPAFPFPQPAAPAPVTPAALPNTGDNVAPWMALAAALGVGFLGLGMALRRRRAY